MLVLMNKRDLSPVASTGACEKRAVRGVVAGAGDEAQGALALEVLKGVQERGLWFG